MTTRFISLATGIVTLDVYLRSQLYSNDPLFLFKSKSIAVNIVLLVLVSLAIGVSFKDKFKSWYSYAACLLLATALLVVGAAGILLSNMDYAFSNFLLPLDYMQIAEVGVILGICGLSHGHAPAPARLRQLPAALINKFALPVPTIPHSPFGLSRPINYRKGSSSGLPA